MGRGRFFPISALDSLLVWYQNLIDWSLIMIWSLESWFDWLINTLYSIKWHILHWFIPCLYVLCCSVTNISRTILHVVLRTTLRSEKKNELRLSYFNTRFAIASNSWWWHPVLHIVTVASTLMSVQKSNDIFIIHDRISIS